MAQQVRNMGVTSPNTDIRIHLSKMKKFMKKYLIVVLKTAAVFLALGIFFPLVAFAQAAVTAAALPTWVSIIVALIGAAGGGGLIAAAFNYWGKKGDQKNDMAKTYIDAASKLRNEYDAMIKELKEDLAALRERVCLLENTLAENNIPIPFKKVDKENSL